MTTASPPERIGDGENLTRFVVSADWVRADLTVKHAAFMPPPLLALSVDRHALLPGVQLWERGKRVAALLGKPLVGRADVGARQVRDPGAPAIDVVAAPLPDDPAHATIVGWPGDKPGQKMIAQRIAASARFIPAPVSSAS